jgi:hypothetical protein
MLKEKFTKRFNDSCLKYRFVHIFWDLIESPPEDSVLFIMNEPHVMNGGHGDRMSGLTSTAMISMRLNRSLMIFSTNGFDKLFRPYRNPANVFNQDNGNSNDSRNTDSKFAYTNWTWTNFKPKFAKHHRTELILFNCFAPNSPEMDIQCGLDYGLKTPRDIVKTRCGRSYLCRWAQHSYLPASKDLKKLGVDSNSDLFEVAGCVLRLVMWPTDYLWTAFDEYLTGEIDKLNNKTSTAHSLPNNNSSRNESGYLLNNEKTFAFNENTKIVGMHYRCGDHSYTNPKESVRKCQYDVWGNDPHEISTYMRYGTPVDLGRCSKDVISDYINSKASSNDDRNNVLALIASDNIGSSVQMKNFTEWDNVIVQPNGCHVDLTKSEDCTFETSLHWLMLSFSDKMVSQTQNRIPISAFSRSAVMYGLAGDDVFRDAKACRNTLPKKNISYYERGNWVCQ